MQQPPAPPQYQAPPQPTYAPPAPAPAPPAPPQPAPAAGPRPLNPIEHDPEVAIPVIHALDRPQRVEIELAGELRISGELKAFSLKPATPDTHPGEQS